MSIICATCLRCSHEGTISPETLRKYAQSPNVTLAYLSRFTKCQVCGSKAVKLERKRGEAETASGVSRRVVR
jgi:hypothetical protein